MKRESKVEYLLREVVRQQLAVARELLSVEEGLPLTLVVAVSGGEDSVVLLDAVSSQQEKLNLKLIVAHLDHGLRDSSAEDAEFVESVAKSAGLAFELERAGARPANENIEAWAREQRYSFLQRVRVRGNAHLVLTAHHQNDQAETVLFRLLTGRMATDSHTLALLDLQRMLCRPLLHLSKQMIVAYRQERNLDFVVDETNEDCNRTRNRIRHDLLPKLETDFNPRIVEGLALVAARLKNDEDFIWQEASNVWESIDRSCNVKRLAELAPALCWRVLKLVAVEQLGEEAQKLGYKSLASLSEKVIAGLLESGRVYELGLCISCELGSAQALKFFIARAEGQSIDSGF